MNPYRCDEKHPPLSLPTWGPTCWNGRVWRCLLTAAAPALSSVLFSARQAPSSVSGSPSQQLPSPASECLTLLSLFPAFVQLEHSYHSSRPLLKLPLCTRHCGLPSQHPLPLLITELIYIYISIRCSRPPLQEASPVTQALLPSPVLTTEA